VTASAVPLQELNVSALAAGALGQALRERNRPGAAHFARALRELGRALGCTTEAPAEGGAFEAVWVRDGRPVVRFAFLDALSASQVLRALPPDRAGPTVLVVVGGEVPEGEALAALRKVVPRSRPALTAGDTHVLVPIAGGGGRVLEGDLVADVLEGRPLRPADPEGASVGPNPSRDAADFPLFPYLQLRDGQRALMNDVRAAVEGRKVLLAHAPTGIGKTAAVLAEALEAARVRGKTVYFLTSRQTQHRIAVETLREVEAATQQAPRVVDLVSKQSMCPRPERPEHSSSFYEWCQHLTENRKCRYFLKPTERAVGVLAREILDVDASVRSSARLGCCPYKVAVEAAKGAEVVVCDYNILFNKRNRSLDRQGLDPGDLIVVVDEAHNLPDRIRDAAGGRVTHALLTQAVAEMTQEDPELAHGLKALVKVFDELIGGTDEGAERQVTGPDLNEPLAKALTSALVPRTLDQYLEELAKAAREVVGSVEGRSATLEVVDFLAAWKQPEKETLRVVERKDPPALRITLLDPSSVSGPMFEAVHAAVLMSGTLYPMELTADMLGVPPASRILESYPSPFVAERRRVLLLRGVSTRYKDRGEAMYGRIAGAIHETARATPGNIAVFFTSYKMRDEIADRLPKRMGRELIFETRDMSKGEKDRLVARLKRHEKRGGALLLAVMGGSFSEGVDFYDGILKAVVVVGLPLAPPSREVDALVGYFDRKFGAGAGELYAYVNPAVTRVLQAAGRLIRREEDRGVVVLMDGRLEQARYARVLPPDFVPEAVDGPEELGAQVRAFFAKGA
jgi:DNA excision repair protein ERCC-2